MNQVVLARAKWGPPGTNLPLQLGVDWIPELYSIIYERGARIERGATLRYITRRFALQLCSLEHTR